MKFNVVVVPVVDADALNPTFLVTSVESTMKTVSFLNDLLINVSVVFRPIKVSVTVGRVKVPVLTILEIVGRMNVLLLKISVVALPINVSVDEGNVNIPPLLIVEIAGEVSVLFVKVSTEFFVTIVSLMSGNNIVLFALCVKLKLVVVPVVLADALNPIFLV